MGSFLSITAISLYPSSAPYPQQQRLPAATDSTTSPKASETTTKALNPDIIRAVPVMKRLDHQRTKSVRNISTASATSRLGTDGKIFDQNLIVLGEAAPVWPELDGKHPLCETLQQTLGSLLDYQLQ